MKARRLHDHAGETTWALILDKGEETIEVAGGCGV